MKFRKGGEERRGEARRGGWKGRTIGEQNSKRVKVQNSRR